MIPSQYTSFAHREVMAPVGLWERGVEASGYIPPSARLLPLLSLTSPQGDRSMRCPLSCLHTPGAHRASKALAIPPSGGTALSARTASVSAPHPSLSKNREVRFLEFFDLVSRVFPLGNQRQGFYQSMEKRNHPSPTLWARLKAEIPQIHHAQDKARELLSEGGALCRERFKVNQNTWNSKLFWIKCPQGDASRQQAIYRWLGQLIQFSSEVAKCAYENGCASLLKLAQLFEPCIPLVIDLCMGGEVNQGSCQDRGNRRKNGCNQRLIYRDPIGEEATKKNNGAKDCTDNYQEYKCGGQNQFSVFHTGNSKSADGDRQEGGRA